MKKSKLQETFFTELTKVPIVQVACEKTGVSRNSVYKWRKADPAFAKKMDQALIEGVALVNDMGESQLLTLIKEKNYSAIAFWLRHRNDNYKQKLEVRHESIHTDLTDEQKDIINKTLTILKDTYEK